MTKAETGVLKLRIAHICAVVGNIERLVYSWELGQAVLTAINWAI